LEWIQAPFGNDLELVLKYQGDNFAVMHVFKGQLQNEKTFFMRG
jgi:hypothetical protein